MLFKNVDQKIVDECAEMIGAFVYRQSSDPKRGLLRPNKDCKFRRVSASYFNQGRKVNAVCWHGHRDFFRCLFEKAPEAIVQTHWLSKETITYTAENFEQVFWETDVNIGPPIAPMLASEACSCPEGMF